MGKNQWRIHGKYGPGIFMKNGWSGYCPFTWEGMPYSPAKLRPGKCWPT